VRWLCFLLIGLVLGGGFGWVVRGTFGGGVESAQEAVDVPRAILERSSGRIVDRGISHSAGKANLKEFIEGHRFEEKIKELDVDDIEDLLLQLQERAGLFGMDYRDETRFQKLLFHWYELDPQGAIEWLNGLPKKEDRVKLVSNLAGRLAGKNLDEAITLLQGNLRKDDGYVLPLSFLGEAAKVSAEKYLEVVELSMTSGVDSSTSTKIVFPLDFDFRAVFDGLAQLQEGAEDGTKVRSSHSNLMSTWAERDPEGAFQWLEDGGKVYGQGLNNYLKGFAKIRDAEEVGSFLATAFDSESSSYDQYYMIREGLKVKPDLMLIESVFENLPGDKVKHASGIMRAIGVWDGDLARSQELVLRGLSHEERHKALRSPEMARYLKQPKAYQAVTASLMALGYGGDEVSSILPQSSSINAEEGSGSGDDPFADD